MLAWQNLSPCIVHCNFVVTQGCVTEKLFPTEFTSVSLDTRVDFQMYIKTAFLCVAFATDVAFECSSLYPRYFRSAPDPIYLSRASDADTFISASHSHNNGTRTGLPCCTGPSPGLLLPSLSVAAIGRTLGECCRCYSSYVSAN